MTGPGDLRLDPARTIRAAAGIGLAVLGISLLPDLLTPNEPEPLPADVGFRPDENLAPTALSMPVPSPPTVTDSERTERTRNEASAGRARGRGKTRPSKNGRGTKRTGERPGQGWRSPRADAPRDRPAAPPPAQALPPSPVPAWTPPPAPPPAPVGDGSIEFAPR